MILSRILTTGAAAVLIGVSTLAIGGSAVAADFYLDDSELTATETSPYAAGWFQGNVAPGGSFTSTASGLDVTGQFQLLNGTPNATDLLAVGASADITLASGNASFQIPMFTDGAGGGYTTLYADAAGIAADLWYTSTAFGTFAANDSATLAAFEAEMDPGYEILAFGFHVIAGDSAEVVSLTWAGNTYWFLPAAPTATAAPSSITLDDFADTGVALTFTGYVPGEDVILGASTPNSAGIVDTVLADTNGVVSYTLVGDANSALGNYDITATGLTSDVQATTSFAVTANPAELAATGAEVTPFVIAGSVLLLTGAAGLGAVAIRRRPAATRS